MVQILRQRRKVRKKAVVWISTETDVLHVAKVVHAEALIRREVRHVVREADWGLVLLTWQTVIQASDW